MSNSTGFRVKGLSLDNKAEILTTSTDPSVSGYAALKGSLLLYTPTGSASAKLFQRFGSGSTDWRDISVASSASSEMVTDYLLATETVVSPVNLNGSSWNVRALNGAPQYSGSSIVLVGSTVTLSPGKYRVLGRAYASASVGASTVSIVDVTSGLTTGGQAGDIAAYTLLTGITSVGPGTVEVSGYVTVMVETMVQLWHYASTGSANGGSSQSSGGASSLLVERVANMDATVGLAAASVKSTSGTQSVATLPSSTPVQFNAVSHQSGIVVNIGNDVGGTIGSSWNLVVSIPGTYFFSAIFSLGPISGASSGGTLTLYKNNVQYLVTTVPENMDTGEIDISLQTVIACDSGDSFYLKIASTSTGPVGSLKDCSIARLGSVSDVTVAGSGSSYSEYFLYDKFKYTGTSNTFVRSITLSPTTSSRVRIICAHRSGTIPQIRLGSFSSYHVKKIYNGAVIDGIDDITSYIELGAGDSSYTETTVELAVGAYRRAMQNLSYKDIVDNVVGINSWELRDSSTPLNQLTIFVGTDTVADLTFLYSYDDAQPGIGPTFTGATGAPGLTGSIGLRGITGPSGITGITFGATGVAGFTGLGGHTGVQGLTGIRGFTGNIGSTGTKGSTGVVGSQGLTGTQGLMGFTGAQGLDAPLMNFKGTLLLSTDFPALGLRVNGDVYGVDADGITDSVTEQTFMLGDWIAWQSTGSVWSKVNGVRGPQGDQGLVGPGGPVGAQGGTGVAGIQGVQGFIGLQGSAGSTGPQGLTGLAGYTGVSGLLGGTGLRGLQGSTGFQGSTGVQGFTGAQGQAADVMRFKGRIVVPSDFPPEINRLNGDLYAVFANVVDPVTAQAFTADDWIVWEDSSTLWVITGNNSTSTSGATGSQGIQGTPGIQGFTGLPGIAGTLGVTGSRGDTGALGPQGVTGVSFNSSFVMSFTSADLVGGSLTVPHDIGVAGLVIAVYTSPEGGQEYTAFTKTLTDTNTATLHFTNPGDITGVWSVAVLAAGGIGSPGVTGTIGPRGPRSFQLLSGPETVSSEFYQRLGANYVAAGTYKVHVLVDESSGPTTVAWRLWDLTTASEVLVGYATSMVDSSGELSLIDGTVLEYHAQGTGTLVSLLLEEVLSTEPGRGGPGITGGQGPRGFTGPEGVTGVSGLNGASGYTGMSGATGPKGASGTQGMTGASGLSIVGSTGISGVTGISGISGVTGAQGLRAFAILAGPVDVSTGVYQRVGASSLAAKSYSVSVLVDNNGGSGNINWRIWNPLSSSALASGLAVSQVDSTGSFSVATKTLVEYHVLGTGTVLSLQILEA